MKITHRLNPGYFRESGPVVLSDRYQSEVDASVRKAEKAWRAAEKALARAEVVAARRQEPHLITLRDEARVAVLQRLDELRTLQELMNAPMGGANHSGRGSVRAIPTKNKTL